MVSVSSLTPQGFIRYFTNGNFTIVTAFKSIVGNEANMKILIKIPAI